MAITKACKAVSMVLAEEGVLNEVTIYSNSQSVLQTLNSRWLLQSMCANFANFKAFLFQKWKMRWETADPESFRKSRKILALPRDIFSRMRWVTGHAYLRLQNFRADSSVKQMIMCRYCLHRKKRADHIILKCVRLRLPR